MVGGILVDGGGEVLRGGVEVAGDELLVARSLVLGGGRALLGGHLRRRAREEREGKVGEVSGGASHGRGGSIFRHRPSATSGGGWRGRRANPERKAAARRRARGTKRPEIHDSRGRNARDAFECEVPAGASARAASPSAPRRADRTADQPIHTPPRRRKRIATRDAIATGEETHVGGGLLAALLLGLVGGHVD